MSDDTQTPTALAENEGRPTTTPNPNISGRPTHRGPSRPTNAQASTPRDYAGAVPEIGGILALRSENLTHKVNYDIFCEKLGVYIMNEFKIEGML